MEAILDAQGLWESIYPPAGRAVDEKKNKSAKAFVFQGLSEDILLQVAKKKTAREVWDSLKTRYLGAERVQKARIHTLNKEFEGLRMNDEETIDEFTGRLSGMASKFNSLGATIEDSTLVRKLLDSVPDKYLQLVASIEQYSDIDSMPFEEAIGRLKAYEDRLKLRSGNSSGETSLLFTKTVGNSNNKGTGGAFTSGGRGRGWNERGGRGGGRGRGRGRSSRNGNQGQRDGGNTNHKPRDKKHIKCFNCNKFGHYASECKEPKEMSDEANLTQIYEEESALLLTVCGEKVESLVLLNEEKVFPERIKASDENGKDVWYLDNGASNHMTGSRSFFAELDERVTGAVRFGDGSKVAIAGKGTILLECRNGEQQILSEVYFIPSLHSNIISLG